MSLSLDSIFDPGTPEVGGNAGEDRMDDDEVEEIVCDPVPGGGRGSSATGHREGGSGAEGAVEVSGGSVARSREVAEFTVKYWKEKLYDSVDVYTYLTGCLENLDLGEGIVNLLESVDVAKLTVHEEWSKAWEGWAELVLKIRTMESLGSEDYMEDVLGCISEVVRRFVQHAESHRGGSNFPTDRERLGELVADGLVHGHGEV